MPSSRSKRSTRQVAVLLAAAAWLVGCGAAAPAKPAPKAAAPAIAPVATGSTAAPLVHVSLQLPWLIAGYDGAFVAAQANGDYRREGLDVSISQSTGSLATAEDIANGSYTFGFSDDSSVAGLISKGAPEKVLATFVQETPVDFIYNPGISLPDAAALKGMTVISDVGGASQQLLPAVLKQGGLTMSDIHFVATAASALAASLNAHPKAVLAGFSNSLYPLVLKVDPRAKSTLISKFGVNTLSLGLFTTLKEIDAHPALVRRFVAASVLGWEFAQAHPRQTVRLTLKAFPKSNAFILQKSLQYTLPLLHTPASQGKPLGWTATSDWTTTLQLLHQYAGLTVVKPVGDYFTNAYLPAS